MINSRRLVSKGSRDERTLRNASYDFLLLSVVVLRLHLSLRRALSESSKSKQHYCISTHRWRHVNTYTLYRTVTPGSNSISQRPKVFPLYLYPNHAFHGLSLESVCPSLITLSWGRL